MSFLGAKRPGRPGRCKRFAFWCVPLFLVIAASELASLAALTLLGGPAPDARLTASLLQEGLVAAAEDGDDALHSTDDQVPHPYLGAAHPPTEDIFPAIGDPDTLENFGFGPGSGPFVRTPRENQVIVGVFGGSVAKQFALYGPTELLAKKLQSLPEFAGKEIVFTAAANYGYKQPQQLMTLNFLLAAGAHFDVLLEIDGFNEVAMPYEEAYALQVFPFYPRFWNVRMQSLNSAPEMRGIIGLIGLYHDRQERAARFMQESLLGKSMTAKLLWQMYDRELQAKIQHEQEALFSQRAGAEAGYVVTGPSRIYEDNDEFFNDIVLNWQESSRLMRTIAETSGMRYFHVLQPNQYVPGSKPMGPEERAVAFRENHYYRNDVEWGYPLLRLGGQQLKNEGMHFYDMTMLFAETEEQAYIDDCCHINPFGQRLLAEAIGDAIVADLASDLP